MKMEGILNILMIIRGLEKKIGLQLGIYTFTKGCTIVYK